MTAADSDMAHAPDALNRAAIAGHDELDRLGELITSKQVEIQHLQEALHTARTIGMALGVIMEREKLTPDQAFTKLAKLSQRANQKLRILAEQIVLTGEY